MAQPAGICHFTWTCRLDGVLIHEGEYELDLEVEHTRNDEWTVDVVGVSVVDERWDRSNCCYAETGRVQLMSRADPIAAAHSLAIKAAAEKDASVLEAALNNIGNPHFVGAHRRVA